MGEGESDWVPVKYGVTTQVISYTDTLRDVDPDGDSGDWLRYMSNGK